MSKTATVKVSDLIGRQEAAEILGVVPQHINNLLHRKPSFPRPLVTLRSGMIFSRAEIEAWARGRELLK